MCAEAFGHCDLTGKQSVCTFHCIRMDSGDFLPATCLFLGECGHPRCKHIAWRT